MALVIKTPPNFYPVSLDEAKDHLRVTATDEDSVISRCLWAATKWIEEYTGRKLCTQTWTYYLDKWPHDILTMPFPKLASVTTVKYYNGSDVLTTLTENTDYRVDAFSVPGRIEPINSWPSYYDKVNPIQIEFVCGQARADIDEDLKQAVLLMASDLFENRQSEFVSTGPLSIQDTGSYKNLVTFYRIFDRSW